MITGKTFTKRLEYLNDLRLLGEFTFSDMETYTEKYKISRAVPYYLKKAGLVTTSNSGKWQLIEIPNITILDQLKKYEKKRNDDWYQKRSKKAKESSDLTMKEQSCIEFLKERGYKIYKYSEV